MNEQEWLTEKDIAEMRELSAIFEVENCRRLLADLAEAKAIILRGTMTGVPALEIDVKFHERKGAADRCD